MQYLANKAAMVMWFGFLQFLQYGTMLSNLLIKGKQTTVAHHIYKRVVYLIFICC